MLPTSFRFRAVGEGIRDWIHLDNGSREDLWIIGKIKPEDMHVSTFEEAFSGTIERLGVGILVRAADLLS